MSEDFNFKCLDDKIVINDKHTLFIPRNLQKHILESFSGETDKETCIGQIQKVLERFKGESIKIVGLPDMHLGYSFPIGSVVSVPRSAWIAPEGVGYDINCGVRCLVTDLTHEMIKPFLQELAEELKESIPAGQETTKLKNLNQKVMQEILMGGIKALYENSGAVVLKNRVLPLLYEDYQNYDSMVEDGGSVEGVALDQKLIGKGLKMLGTLGSGNHYLEIQSIEETFEATDLKVGQIVIFIHCGSRGIGHEVCTKFSGGDLFLDFQSEEGQSYFKAMNAASNYGYVNREILSMLAKEVLQKYFPDVKVDILYDCGHNIAKKEIVDGVEYLVHRKGAARAFPGQYVAAGGSMATSSYLLRGWESGRTFYSTCHGAGRLVPRKESYKIQSIEQIKRGLKKKQILVMCNTKSGIIEEAGECYKNIEEIVDHCEKMRITKKVTKNRPLIVIKG